MPTIADSFRIHQTIILDLLDAAAVLLQAEASPPAWQLDESRKAIGSALDAYQAFKRNEVYDPIIASGSPDAPTAAALKADCTRLTAEYREFCAIHPPESMAFDAYRHETLDLLHRIRLALIREFELVRQLGVYGGPATRLAH